MHEVVHLCDVDVVANMWTHLDGLHIWNIHLHTHVQYISCIQNTFTDTKAVLKITSQSVTLSTVQSLACAVLSLLSLVK